MRGILKITLLSDTCFSAPSTQSAMIDTDIAADRWGLPTLHGKTLQGLLRDTWLSVQETLDPESEGYALFGRSKSNDGDALLHIGTAALPHDVRERVEWAASWDSNRVSRETLLSGFTVERTLTAEDRETGAPLKESLRTLRAITAGVTLEAEVTTHSALTGVQQELLDSLAALTRHAGLHRNRGLGHIRLCFQWEKEAISSDKAEFSWKVASKKGTIFLPLRLTLNSPCLITERETDPNSSRSRDYIQGAALRGAVAAALARLGAEEKTLHEVLVSGKVCFLNATPEVKGWRSLPASIAWKREKDPGKTDAESAVASVLLPLFVSDADDEDELSKKQLEPLSSSFLSENNGRSFPGKAQKNFTVHQQRDRATGHASEGKSTVYVYEALSAGQTFIGCIAIPAERADLKQLLEQALRQPLWLGRARRTGYGGNPTLSLPKSWKEDTETGEHPKVIEEGEYFHLQLTSDALLRNPVTGQHDPWSLKTALQDRMSEIAEITAVCIKPGSIRGYNRLWGCELPGLPCAAAGSTVLLKAKRRLTESDLIILQSQPLGERTAEGSGRFLLRPEKKRVYMEVPDRSAANEPNSPVPEILKQVQRRIFGEELHTLVTDLALQDAKKASYIPTSSCLGRVRVALASDTWRETMNAWFGTTDHRLKEAASKQLEKCKIGTKNLKAVLTEAGNDTFTLPLREGGIRQEKSVMPEGEAVELWNSIKRDMIRLYLEVLLNALSRRTQEDKL